MLTLIHFINYYFNYKISLPKITMKIKTNFLNDISEYFKTELDKNGFKNIPTDPNQVIVAYFKIMHQIISSIPRKIKKSDVFTCPVECEEGLKKLEEKIIQGNNINNHQSSTIFDLTNNDKLFNDWGILHLHLGINLENNKMIERTKFVLFIFLADDTCYFIQILDHHNWTNVELLEIIDRNWSDLISDSHIKTAIDIRYEVSNESIKQFRKSGLSSLTKINDKIFAPPGGGYATAGNSIVALMQSDWFLRELYNFEKQLQQNTREYEKKVKSAIGTKLFEIELKPFIKNGKLFAKDTNYGINFELGRLCSITNPN